MRDFLNIIIAIIVTVLLFVGLYIFVDQMNISCDDKVWNNGHCDVCEGNWEYEQAVGHKASTSYIYVCRKCGKRIEIHEMR